MNKILTIGGESFLLNETTTDADLLKMLTILGTSKRLDSGGNYIPNAETKYGETVNIIKNRAVEVEVKLTATRVLTDTQYNKERDAGLALYIAAHPEGKEGLVHA